MKSFKAALYSNLILFQLGIARSSRAILLLWEDLKTRYPSLDFLMIARLNQVLHDIIPGFCHAHELTILPFPLLQDVLENFFSMVRGLGRK